MSDTIDDYFKALQRLRARNAKISNDAVAVEAGRKKGSIKKSRPQFAALILAIDNAALAIASSEESLDARLKRSRAECKALRTKLDESLAREVNLLRQVFELQQQITVVTSGSVTPINRKHKRSNDY